MKRIILEHSDEEFYTSTSGIALVGHALNGFTNLTSSIANAVPLFHGIRHADVIRFFCALLAQGKSDYEAIEQHWEDDFFREALGLSQVPSEATLRRRMDDHAAEFLRVVSWATVEFLMKTEVPLTSFSTGHICGGHRWFRDGQLRHEERVCQPHLSKLRRIPCNAGLPRQ
jgi:hypothetical protein